jgi:hypothetical protein
VIRIGRVEEVIEFNVYLYAGRNWPGAEVDEDLSSGMSSS